MNNPLNQDPHDDELVPEDDAVIGRALRRSAIGIGVLLIIVAAAILISRKSPEVAPVHTLDAEAPLIVETKVQAPVVQFTDIAAASNINFRHFNGATGDKLLPESMGSGAAFFDFDNDLDQDLLLVNATTWSHSSSSERHDPTTLYRNDGSGSFEDFSLAAGLGFKIYGTGVAVGDYDGDGWIDVFVSAVGKNRLLQNRQGRLVDVTDSAGVAGGHSSWSSGAAFMDYDNDGDLDLFVCNYVKWSKEIDFEINYRLTGVGKAYGPPVNYAGTHSSLYRNNGDGTFDDVSAEAGIQISNPATGVPVGKALGVAPVDIDRDGWIDLLIANDTVQNFFFHNHQDGSFEETGEIYGLAYGRNGEATGAMGLDSAYYRNDNELGFAIGNFANEMTSLYISQGDPTLFADESIGEGIGAPTRTKLSFGTLLFDYDLDGRLDLLQTNGHLESEINTVDPSQTYEQASQLFWNAGPEQRQTFVPVDGGTTGDLSQQIVGRGSAIADIDADGDLDLVLTQVGKTPLLLRNDQSIGNNWLRIHLQGQNGRQSAIGAWVTLVSNGVTQRRQVMPTRSYLSQSELPLTFGLGTATSIDSINITWPDGEEQTVQPPTPNQQIVVVKQ
jgi:hypothetical protein